MNEVTPMLRQFYDIKSQYPGCILFFRLGDFYEMFEDDAVIGSKVLDITLTSRDAGKRGRIPMCGVPHHAAEGYIQTLVQSGHRVAICEQVEDPKEAKGVVKRDVVRVVTPGTVLDGGLLDARQPNYLAAVALQKSHMATDGGEQTYRYHFGLAFCDPSTGHFTCTELAGPDAWLHLKEEMARRRPAEVIVDPSMDEHDAHRFMDLFTDTPPAFVTDADETSFHFQHANKRLKEHFRVNSLDGFGLGDMRVAVEAAGAVVAYLAHAHKTALTQLTTVSTYGLHDRMLLDASTVRNLEINRTMRRNEKRGSLSWLLDETNTAMGGRLLSQWMVEPLLDPEAIGARLHATDCLVAKPDLRFGVRKQLEQMADIERLMGRVAYGSANARDLKHLQRSLSAVPPLKDMLTAEKIDGRLRHLGDAIDVCDDVATDIADTLVDEPPTSISEGGMIREGYDSELDTLKNAASEGRTWVASLERSERERTGIKSLKVGFNKVFGYYIEVTRPNLSSVPEEYERRQTLANAERFITPALKEREAIILGADERIVEREHRLFLQLRERVASHMTRLQRLARIIAEIDVYASFAETAVRRRYVRPVVSEQEGIVIKGGRHPIVEALAAGGDFVPNDVTLQGDTQIIMLTGPNMAGKSTFLRQVALIALMAQIGSFVPADEAHMGIVDRIFTRVGASDDLATGQSTFMVEMNEVANILNHATERSLIILDEVGRGTSTFDGVSIAWAVTEHLHDMGETGPKTLFATHYHELTSLASQLERVKNFTVAVHKQGRDIVFLRRIIPGGADQSYGIEVARLAGLPDSVLRRAQSLLLHMETYGTPDRGQVGEGSTTDERRPLEDGLQLSLFQHTDPLIMRLSEIDPDDMTPLDALNLLAQLTDEIGKRGRAG